MIDVRYFKIRLCLKYTRYDILERGKKEDRNGF